MLKDYGHEVMLPKPTIMKTMMQAQKYGYKITQVCSQYKFATFPTDFNTTRKTNARHKYKE